MNIYFTQIHRSATLEKSNSFNWIINCATLKSLKDWVILQICNFGQFPGNLSKIFSQILLTNIFSVNKEERRFISILSTLYEICQRIIYNMMLISTA